MPAVNKSKLLGPGHPPGIEIVQSFGKKHLGGAISPAAGEALCRGGGPAAVSAAKNVPNVAVSLAGAVGVSVQTPSLAASASMTARVSAVIPTGTMARVGAKVANGALELIGQIKDPFDLSVAYFSAFACGIGR